MSEATAIKTIAIVGGGTAGWMAANLRVARKSHRVVVIESVDIGTVGVGEALTSFFHVFLSHLQYDPLVFVRDVGGSIKLAVRFENWRGTGDAYYHPFLDGSSFFEHPDFAVTPGYNRLLSYGVLEGVPLHDLTTSYALLTEQSRVPWLQDFRLDSDQRFGFGSYAFQMMDTRRFSQTFRDRATRPGVDHRDLLGCGTSPRPIRCNAHRGSSRHLYYHYSRRASSFNRSCSTTIRLTSGPRTPALGGWARPGLGCYS